MLQNKCWKQFVLFSFENHLQSFQKQLNSGRSDTKSETNYNNEYSFLDTIIAR